MILLFFNRFVIMLKIATWIFLMFSGGLSCGQPNDVKAYYVANKGNSESSRSTGTVGNGGLINGKLMPYVGPNFRYFDKQSYTSGRAYTHHLVKKTVLDAYKELETALPGRQFRLMECSNKKGGKIAPHRTHQNGMSVDLMMPKLKNGQPDYSLDDLGARHYFLRFDDKGHYEEDPSITIDFEAIAKHLLILEKQARKNGLKIKKVIIKIEFKDELFATPSGKKLKASGIYVVRGLKPLINNLHDEHFHVDFAPL